MVYTSLALVFGYVKAVFMLNDIEIPLSMGREWFRVGDEQSLYHF